MMGRENNHGRARLCGRLVAAALAVGYLVISGASVLGASVPKAPAASKAAPAKPAPTEKAPPTAPKAPTIETAPSPPEETGGTPGASQTVAAGEGRIDLHCKNEELANVLELLAREYKLNIIASRNVKGKVTADLYHVTIDQIMDAITRANGLKWNREQGAIYIFTAEEATAMRLDEARLATEVFPLNYLAGEDATKFIAPALSAKGIAAVNTATEKGLESGTGASTGHNTFGLQDAIIVRDFPENLEQIRAILKQMDRRPRQVLVEATILQVDLKDTTSLGVNFNALAGVDFRDLSVTNVPAPNPGAPASATTTTVPADKGPFGQAFTTGFATQTTGLNIGVMTNNVSFFIHALEEVTDTVTLSNPKVLAINKQRAEVIVGERIPYITSTATETTTVQTVNFLDVGTQLIFRPFISDDGYVRMEVHPKVSSAILIGPQSLPDETTTEVTANIMVRDGHTIVIGGLFSEQDKRTRSQVPGLGNIPGVGWLFRSNENKSDRHEIVILLTPHIIDNADAANEIGQQTLDDARRRCIGVREGFAWFTRERITVGYVQEADRAWQRYEKTASTEELNSAWWNVQLALNCMPGNLKALRLKDRILSERKGEPYEPQNWTIWDSVQERLQAVDEAKRAAAEKAAPEKKPPAPPATTAPPAGGKKPATEKPKAETKPAAKDTAAKPQEAKNAK